MQELSKATTVYGAPLRQVEKQYLRTEEWNLKNQDLYLHQDGQVCPKDEELVAYRPLNLS